MKYIGELAGIATSITFAINSALFTVAGRRVGSVVVNRVRMILAFMFLMGAHWLFLGDPDPGPGGTGALDVAGPVRDRGICAG